MNNRKEELEFGKQMDASPDKKEVADLVVKYKRKNVLDLGAGTGIISKLIAKRGIKATAVDYNFKIDELEQIDNLTYFQVDLLTFVQTTARFVSPVKYDCIILSAVLHELTKKEFNLLKRDLHKIMSDDCIIIIREPYYEQVRDGFKIYYLPYFSKGAQRNAVEEIENKTPEEFKKLFRTAKKVSGRRVPKSIEALNMAFTYSYGKDSWEREIEEYRFTFSYKDLKKFCDAAYKYKHFILEEVKFDTSYIKYFKACGYSDNVLKSINYTNGLLIALPVGYKI